MSRNEESASPQPDDRAASAPLKDLRVLLVDDSADNRLLFAIFLKGSGADVTTADDGKQGVELAMSGKFDIVLMDIQMPVMNGHDAMIQLNNLGYKGPVIALSAHAMREDREASLKLGFCDYLTKPVSRVLLISTVSAFRG